MSLNGFSYGAQPVYRTGSTLGGMGLGGTMASQGYSMGGVYGGARPMNGYPTMQMGQGYPSVGMPTQRAYSGVGRVVTKRAQPKIKITYFDVQGQVEVGRLALAVGGVDYEDERITFDAFKATIKDTTPNGQLPIMTVNGQVFTQSRAISEYCCQIAGLMPADPAVKCRIDEIVELVNMDIRGRAIAKASIPTEDEARKAARLELANEHLPKWFAILAATIQPSGFFVGNSVTMADFTVYALLNFIGMERLDHVPKTCIEAFPELMKFVRKMNEIPAIKAHNGAKNSKTLPWC